MSYDTLSQYNNSHALPTYVCFSGRFSSELWLGGFWSVSPVAVSGREYLEISGTGLCTDGVTWSVAIVSPAKTAELIEMLFGLWTLLGPMNRVLDGVQISHAKAGCPSCHPTVGVKAPRELKVRTAARTITHWATSFLHP